MSWPDSGLSLFDSSFRKCSSWTTYEKGGESKASTSFTSVQTVFTRLFVSTSWLSSRLRTQPSIFLALKALQLDRSKLTSVKATFANVCAIFFSGDTMKSIQALSSNI